MPLTLALIGRPNVGKSTLFNAMTRSRDALVADFPGLTRDRRYGKIRVDERDLIIIDTGGLTDKATADPSAAISPAIPQMISAQTRLAIEEADILLLILDAREGAVGLDREITDRLRQCGKPIIAVVNKTDGLDESTATAEFHLLGLGDPIPIAAVHRRGLARIFHRIESIFPCEKGKDESAAPAKDTIRVSLIGRPNTGKSTLANRLCGQARMLAHDAPGTTRDSIEIDFEYQGRNYVLIDTAGIRRRARISETIEKFSVVKSLEAIADSDVTVLMLDADEGLSEQDLSLLGLAIKSGRGTVIALNKWDRLSRSERNAFKSEAERRLGFASFCPRCPISAKHGSGLGELMQRIVRCRSSAFARLCASKLTRTLERALDQTPPPLIRGRRIRLRYAHQGGVNPPVIVIHGNRSDCLPEHYRRYLIGRFRAAFDLIGTPIRLELRSGDNPFEGRRNQLTPRQVKKRKRLMRHVARK
ncbi:ribosome biogenesis GTPase Der [Thioalkalivibrio sp. HK1]|uniref:ribosome biogenesis GTPase Der n=1 Tax=Thioalkalivibrio sp. HK1 TaxID=1469245 RepID=UPI0004BA0C00|nr:ribosome biogenesis GTPase Der [Thioalkalivibrio sp. HK1]